MLSPAQIRNLSDHSLLAKIAEEASEVIKAAMKQHAHGAHPISAAGKQYNNVLDLREEFAQLRLLMDDHERRFERWP